MFLGKDVLKIGSKFIGDHPCRSVILIKLQSNFIEIALWHGCSPVNLLHIFRTAFLKNTSGRLLFLVTTKICFFVCNLQFSIAVNFSFCVNIFFCANAIFKIIFVVSFPLKVLTFFLLLVLNNLCRSKRTQNTHND